MKRKIKNKKNHNKKNLINKTISMIKINKSQTSTSFKTIIKISKESEKSVNMIKK